MGGLVVDGLVPGRDCGDCTVCCIVPSIDSAELQKKSNVRCRNLRADAPGCSIYDTRPRACRIYYCGWRRSAVLPDGWRPNVSGVLAEVGILDAPPRFNRVPALTLVLTADADATVREPWFIDFVAEKSASGVAIFLGLPGPRAHLPAKMFFNTAAIHAAPGRDAVRAVLEQCLHTLQAHTYQPQTMTHSGNDAST